MITAPFPAPRAVVRRIARSAPVALLRQAGRPIPTENYVQDGRYVIRADLPGVDPARDVDIAVHNGSIEIRAVRRDGGHHPGDIHYGLFRRVLTLPRDADPGTLTTRYRDGVLEVALDLPGARLT
ncbi:Hsp20/alpha crystallin family protein [Actinomadura kijaniata]|uniref:Hsp20/alpha crystallin family protein n=1 Tax=Actinomadura kijaniata TaxID=46161 RepID=UPI003F1A9147